MVHRHHGAEDVVQEALARAWRSRGSCRTPDTPLPWCLQITRNEALRLIGRQRSTGAVELLEPEIDLEDHAASGEGDQAVDRIDATRALRGLTPHERLLIALR
jgi:DNA-directed RNA polymerase specialized sigma24 family protein